MNTSNELDLIKTILFNALNIADALTRLDDCGIVYRASDTIDFYTIVDHNVSFWKARSNKCPAAVLINDKCFDYDDRKPFFAQQASSELASQVPAAASPDESAEQLSFCQFCHKTNLDTSEGCKAPQVFSPAVGDWVCCYTNMAETEQSTASVDNPRFDYVKSYVKTGFLREILRTERRLKRSQAAGYQL